jgi:hypothetical protein
MASGQPEGEVSEPQPRPRAPQAGVVVRSDEGDQHRLEGDEEQADGHEVGNRTAAGQVCPHQRVGRQDVATATVSTVAGSAMANDDHSAPHRPGVGPGAVEDGAHVVERE